MATFLSRLGRWSAQHRLTVVIAWLAVLLGVGTAAATISQPLSDEFDLPGSDFQVVLEDLQEQIPESAGIIGTVVLSSDDGFDADQEAAVADVVEQWSALDGIADATDPFAAQTQLDEQAGQLETGRADLEAGRAEIEANREELEAGREQLETGQETVDTQRAELEAAQEQAGDSPEILAGLEQLDQTQEQLDAGREQIEAGETQLAEGEAELDAAEAQLDVGERLADLTSGSRVVSEDGTAAMTQIVFDTSTTISPDLADEVTELGDSLADVGVDATYSTELSQDLSSIMGPGEIVGLGIAALVLLIMLGSLVAAGLPLLMAVVGVGTGLGGAIALTAVVEMNSVTPALALMLGLAVGIDYSLFILNRHRAQLRRGMDTVDSIALATGTSGNAVSFAGLTVIIALSALAVTGIPFLAVMGFVAAATVAVAVLVALTLTPAMLSYIGERARSRKERLGGRHTAEAVVAETGEEPVDTRRGWAARVTRHPWVATIGVLAITLVASIPLLDIRLGLPDGSAEPVDSSAYQTYQTIEESFGAGANGPLIAVANLDEAPSDELGVQEAQADIGEQLAGIDGVTQVLPFGVSEDDATIAFQIAPAEGPSAESTVDLVHDLRDAAPGIEQATGSELGFTGATVANIDISEQLGAALAPYLIIVVGLSLVLLLLVFRSVVVPLLATSGFLLSVGAAFGTVVAVYQWGWLGDLFGVHDPGPLLSFLPIILIGVLFGLAMDYQVFLVTSMREAYAHGTPARQAVVEGFNVTARVVVAAAIIMISVFGGFVFAHLTMIRPIGLALAVGVLVDAFLVRMTLTPAVMQILGERIWYIPRWLDRIVPDVDVEGAKLERQVAAAQSGDDGEPGGDGGPRHGAGDGDGEGGEKDPAGTPGQTTRV